MRSRQSNWQRVHCTGAAASCCGFPRLCQSSLRAVAALYYCLTLSLARLSGWLPRPAIVRLSNVQVHLSAVHPPVHLPHSLLLQVAPHGTVLQQLAYQPLSCFSYFSTGLQDDCLIAKPENPVQDSFILVPIGHIETGVNFWSSVISNQD